jgi:DHA1 family multidrug resistance protein-like MFS transporter
MFQNMGNQWALTLLGCLAALLAPVTVIFYFRGARIRKVSRYAPNMAPKGPAVAETKEV